MTHATLPYRVGIADSGPETAAREDRRVAKGVNAVVGHLACGPVAEATGEPFADDLFVALGAGFAGATA